MRSYYRTGGFEDTAIAAMRGGIGLAIPSFGDVEPVAVTDPKRLASDIMPAIEGTVGSGHDI
jgi:hypothetical protein